jgi:hypothetical protein
LAGLIKKLVLSLTRICSGMVQSNPLIPGLFGSNVAWCNRSFRYLSQKFVARVSESSTGKTSCSLSKNYGARYLPVISAFRRKYLSRREGDHDDRKPRFATLIQLFQRSDEPSPEILDMGSHRRPLSKCWHVTLRPERRCHPRTSFARWPGWWGPFKIYGVAEISRMSK